MATRSAGAEADPDSLLPSVSKSLANQTITDAVLQPLSFPEPPKKDFSSFLDPSNDLPIPCMLCDSSFTGGKAKDEVFQHLLTSHKVVIHNVKEICSLKRYFEYWKSRFKSSSLTDFTAVIRTNTRSDVDPSEDFYFLGDALPEDKQFRIQLQQKRLEAILEVQHLERLDTDFLRVCLFCSQTCAGNRTNLFQHMLEAHSFNVGHPDNLVFVNEFLDLLQQKLDSLQCLYCERLFRDRPTLKEHMRKKQHKKINPRNKTYDKFYVINYLEMGKTWEEIESEDDREIAGQEDGSDWDDWEDSQQLVFCLFCKYSSSSYSTALQHMEDVHSFYFTAICQQLKLDYYSQIKLVNYIRRQEHMRSWLYDIQTVHMVCCIHCQQRFSSHDKLLLHMGFKAHFILPPERPKWEQQQYLFPTYENDAFLCGLDDSNEY